MSRSVLLAQMMKMVQMMLGNAWYGLMSWSSITGGGRALSNELQPARTLCAFVSLEGSLPGSPRCPSTQVEGKPRSVPVRARLSQHKRLLFSHSAGSPWGALGGTEARRSACWAPARAQAKHLVPRKKCYCSSRHKHARTCVYHASWHVFWRLSSN